MFNYWSLPEFAQKAVAFFIPKKQTWTFTAKKTVMGDWVFNIPPFVKDEALCGGTEAIIDTYFIQKFGYPPGPNVDQVTIEATTVKPKWHDAVCTDFKSTGGFGHTYTEQNTAMEGWFCPMFEVMFGDEMPDKVYITFS
jgi:hypothetical protein